MLGGKLEAATHAKWIELTLQDEKKPIFVNMTTAISIVAVANGSRAVFQGLRECLTVVEAPEAILKLTGV